MQNTGLLAQQPQAEPAPTEAAAPAGGTPASPEEQMAYEKFVSAAVDLIHDPKNQRVMDAALQTMQTGEPVEGLASAAAMVTARVMDAAQKAGQPVPDDVAYHATAEIIEDLAEVATAAKVQNYTEEHVSGAFIRAGDLLKDRFDKAGLAEDWTALQQADKAGSLDQVAPGLTQKFGGANG